MCGHYRKLLFVDAISSPELRATANVLRIMNKALTTSRLSQSLYSPRTTVWLTPLAHLGLNCSVLFLGAMHSRKSRLLVSSRPSVHLSTRISAAPTGRISAKSDIGDNLWKSVQKIEIWSNRTKTSGTLPENVATFYCCRRHKFAIKALLCNNQWQYIVQSDRQLSNTQKTHCFVSTVTTFTRRGHDVTCADRVQYKIKKKEIAMGHVKIFGKVYLKTWGSHKLRAWNVHDTTLMQYCFTSTLHTQQTKRSNMLLGY
jgi:hypothetical protein